MKPEIGTTIYCIIGDQIIRNEVEFIGKESFLVNASDNCNEFSYCSYEKDWFVDLESAKERLTEMLENGELYDDYEPGEELIIRETDIGYWNFVDKYL